MHARIRPSSSLYEQLEALPETVTGEILDVQLHTQPRPAWPHVVAASGLGYELIGPLQCGRGGFGGGWIIESINLGDPWVSTA